MSQYPNTLQRKKGTDMHNVELTDQAGQPWQLAGALLRGAVVLVFYRGDW
ncbi:MAG: hypothetical protein M3354_09355 [Chloroflexota bacterium]|nr:hypothetical protein [Chloroflexota bacterium]